MRNGFEERVSDSLGPEWAYESIKLPYVIKHTYTPDFVNAANKQIIESKGFFPSQDRQKMLAVKAAHPDWTFVLVFQNPNKTLSKVSKTTYGEWADKHGFEWREGPKPVSRKAKPRQRAA